MLTRARASSSARALSSAASAVTATDLFSSWAREGLDERMEKGHALAVNEMLAKSRQYFPVNYNFLDIGCGNGWVARAESAHEACHSAAGVDGAVDMIEKAKSLIYQGDKAIENSETNPAFYHSDLLSFHPTTKYDVAFSMEVLYYLSEYQVPQFLSSLSKNVVSKNGLLVFGIDHYLENEDSHSWSAIHNTPMLLWSEERWSDEVTKAGFEVLHKWRSGKRENNPEGTMSIVARNIGEDVRDEL